MRAPLLLLTLLLCCSGADARPALTFLAPTNHTMPLAQFQDGKLQAGILKDLGDLLARRLGREARFVSVPSKRVNIALAHGEADAVCYVLPDWIDGQFDWTVPLIPNAVLVIAAKTAPPIHTLAELHDERVGTVLGYRYPQVDAVLGEHFRRDDAPSMLHTFNKLVAGRTRYAIVEQATLDYQLRNDAALAVRPELVFVTFKASCAFARHGALPFAQVEQAVSSLLEDGSVEKMLARYR